MVALDASTGSSSVIEFADGMFTATPKAPLRAHFKERYAGPDPRGEPKGI
jgi:hypothetical protein